VTGLTQQQLWWITLFTAGYEVIILIATQLEEAIAMPQPIQALRITKHLQVLRHLPRIHHWVLIHNPMILYSLSKIMRQNLVFHHASIMLQMSPGNNRLPKIIKLGNKMLSTKTPRHKKRPHVKTMPGNNKTIHR